MKKLSFRKIAYWLHLWLGALSSLVIFIVAVTGCIYVFQLELRSIFQQSQYVEIQDRPFLSPSELKEKANQYVYAVAADSANVIYGVAYGKRDKAATLAYNHYEDGYTILMLNPYSGDYIYKQTLKGDFFRIILAGHRSLWLPYDIGRPIVGWSVLVFVIVTISGIVLWIPKRWNRKSLKSILTIKRKSNSYKLNYDLHKVIGFYVALIALIISITGLTWSFKWFANSYYTVISGGEELKQWKPALSDTTLTASTLNLDDRLWDQVKQEYPIGEQGTFMFDFPNKKADAYRICFNPANDDTYYKRHFRFFDQNTLEELEGGGIYGTAYEDSSAGDKLYRMTYDIHVGAIGGLPGKIVVFLASLGIASLPVTGYIIWHKKRKKSKKGKK
ncbi:PepSY domain-containing protein [Dysgonomonas sp. ZJ709]|uniref:PepSY-associated TM helix domain-containing protein n=1 Tax=Dysgonomonas sp. ZJ709 TaxID=2709797 RepID=UPI0013EB61CF|nr:PepSY-associated TM helix domain-containing protein [Dysgonomonas sp. ZJ709]